MLYAWKINRGSREMDRVGTISRPRKHAAKSSIKSSTGIFGFPETLYPRIRWTKASVQCGYMHRYRNGNTWPKMGILLESELCQ